VEAGSTGSPPLSLSLATSIAEKTGATRDPITSVFLNEVNFASLPDDTNGPAARQSAYKRD
jgi:hypothetical protein